MPSKKATSAKKRPGGKKRVGLTSAIGPKATTFLVICAIAGGIAVGARQREYDKAKASTAETVMAADATTPSPAATKKSAANARPATNASATPVSTSGSTAAKPDASITGCLEQAGDEFRLKKTEGEAAPKSRSWKSGFLKKGSTAVTVVDPSRSLRLGSHVGRRVTVSGTLVDRELRADAIHAVASSCKAN